MQLQGSHHISRSGNGDAKQENGQSNNGNGPEDQAIEGHSTSQMAAGSTENKSLKKGKSQGGIGGRNHKASLSQNVSDGKPPKGSRSSKQ